jgi:MoaA/NifB/PqqE/SkfB family radical SAM enzyme
MHQTNINSTNSNRHNEASLIKKILNKYTDEQLCLVKDHVKKRLESKKANPRLNIVYDLLYECNLYCKGCGVDSKFVKQSTPLSLHDLSPKTEEIFTVLEKIKTYTTKHNKACFINFGGGEPFLRPDLHDIIYKAYSLFGNKSLGLDSNGTIDNEFERIQEMGSYLSYLGISLDGLEEYHNWWRGCGDNRNLFQKTSSLIQKMTKDPNLNSIFEVSSVVTKKNLHQIPALIDFLHALGVKKYSIHRAMCVGRMEYSRDIIPNAEDYFDLLVNIVEKSNNLDMDIHLHYSIESIYATLLLGLNTYNQNKVGNPDLGASFGIDPWGIIVFDPWCVRGVWQKLQSQSLLDKNVELENVLDMQDGSVLDLTKMYASNNIRCNGCNHPCSGGSRIAAAANKLIKNHQKLCTLTESHLLGAMVEIDPACPLHQDNER